MYADQSSSKQTDPILVPMGMFEAHGAVPEPDAQAEWLLEMPGFGAP